MPFRRLLKKWDRKLRILECDCGRDSDWVIELHGQPIAELTEPQYVEMFWHSYRMTPLASGIELSNPLGTIDFWDRHFYELLFRNLEFNVIREAVMVNPEGWASDGRIGARWLYIPEICWPWDSGALWLRSRRRHKEVDDPFPSD